MNQSAIKVVLGAALCGLVWMTAEGGNVGRKSRPKALAGQALPAGCPTDKGEWTGWRDKRIADLLTPRFSTGDGALVDPQQVISQSTVIANVIDDCALNYPNPDELQGLIGNLRSFTEVQRNSLDIYHQFGHGGRPRSNDPDQVDFNDFAYLDRVREQVDLPWLLKSADFLRRIGTPKTYQAALQMIKDHNKTLPEEKKWTTLLYKSGVLATPDQAQTYGRFFILVPGDTYDKWIQFGIKVPKDIDGDKPAETTGSVEKEKMGDAAPINNVSIVSISKPDADGRRHAAMIDWWRLYTNGLDVQLATRRESQGESENCLMCHKTTPLGIHPKAVYTFDPGGNLVLETHQPDKIPDQLNDMIQPDGSKIKGPAKLSTGLDDKFAEVSNYGPPLGPKVRRDVAATQACLQAAGLTGVSLARVTKHMNCSRCHSESDIGMGPLNFPQAIRYRKDSETNSVYRYIKNGWMPPDSDLSDEPGKSEREALYQCLTEEYYDQKTGTGLFVDWLKTGEVLVPPTAASAAVVSRGP